MTNMKLQRLEQEQRRLQRQIQQQQINQTPWYLTPAL